MPHIQVWVSSSFVRPTPANLLIEVFRYLETLIIWGLQCFNATIVPQGGKAAFAILGISRFWPRGSEFRPCLSIRGLWPLKMEADRRRRRLPSSETSPRHHRHQRRQQQQQQHLKEVIWQKQVKGVTQLGVFFTSLSAEVTVTLFHKWRPARFPLPAPSWCQLGSSRIIVTGESAN